MIPGRPERILGHGPAFREYQKVHIGSARRFRRRGQHREDRGIGMIEQERADRREAPQVIFIRRVVAVPGNDVERRLLDLARIELAAPFHEQGRGLLHVVIGGDRGEEVARIGKAIGPDRAAIRQREGAAVVLAHIGARRPFDELDPEDHAALDDTDLPGLDLDHPELRAQAQLASLCHDEQFAVGIAEIFAPHRRGDEEHMCCHAGASFRIACSGHGAQPVHERETFGRHGNGSPAHLPDGQCALEPRLRCRADEVLVHAAEAAGMFHARADSVEPGALIAPLRRGERRAGKLLGIEPVAHLLGRIASDRQCAGERLGLERIAEPRHVAWRMGGACKVGRREARSILDVHGRCSRADDRRYSSARGAKGGQNRLAWSQ